MREKKLIKSFSKIKLFLAESSFISISNWGLPEINCLYIVVNLCIAETGGL